MQKVSYEISKHRESKEWVVWKINTDLRPKEGRGGMSTRGIFRGTKKECQEKLKEIKENDNRRTIKIRKKQ